MFDVCRIFGCEANVGIRYADVRTLENGQVDGKEDEEMGERGEIYRASLAYVTHILREPSVKG